MEFNFKKWKSFIVISIKLLQSVEHATALRGKSTARTREFIANIFRALCFSHWNFHFFFPMEINGENARSETCNREASEKVVAALKMTLRDANELHCKISPQLAPLQRNENLDDVIENFEHSKTY